MSFARSRLVTLIACVALALVLSCSSKDDPARVVRPMLATLDVTVQRPGGTPAYGVFVLLFDPVTKKQDLHGTDGKGHTSFTSLQAHEYSVGALDPYSSQQGDTILAIQAPVTSLVLTMRSQ